mgnify:CR=1 FL=1
MGGDFEKVAGDTESNINRGNGDGSMNRTELEKNIYGNNFFIP